MRISRKAEYALRALLAMARQPRCWSIQELSVRENIPVKFLEQILLSLRHAGLLTSKRGVGGGYTLLKAAGDVTIAEVLRVFDGPLALVACAIDRPLERCTCPDPRTCPLRHTMTELHRELTTLFESRTLEDMLRAAPDAGALAFEI
ncbi:MAG TPA: Rrf2 family transcriptional regulator [Chthoniobacteraceae bacterium]|jgi:Rrf2 family protein|nr:Rrf2 family protein [Chthoniobacter sp.]HEV7867069.1 Rrf2 family transcriptional regulator [Chthoniobacteraceae bacterium]